jgi:hypothetical protein
VAERARTAARRWFPDSGAQADARRDEASRLVGAEILDEPIPEKLLEVLHGERGGRLGRPQRTSAALPSCGDASREV